MKEGHVCQIDYWVEFNIFWECRGLYILCCLVRLTIPAALFCHRLSARFEIAIIFLTFTNTIFFPPALQLLMGIHSYKVPSDVIFFF